MRQGADSRHPADAPVPPTANTDVTIVLEGILRPAVVVTVSLTDEEAASEAVNAAARRAAEVAEQVKLGRGGVGGVTVGFEYGGR